MVDTIVLRLHNIRNYERAIRVFLEKEQNGTTQEMVQAPKSEIDKLKKIYKDPTQIFRMLRFNRTGDFLIKSQSGKKKQTSGNYEFSFSINWK